MSMNNFVAEKVIERINEVDALVADLKLSISGKLPHSKLSMNQIIDKLRALALIEGV